LSPNKLLLVWVYYPAVGHLVEALEVAANYYAANPNLEIHVVVNSKTPYKIGAYCDFIHQIYPLSLEDYKDQNKTIEILNDVAFDYIVFPKRLKYTPQDFPAPLLACNRFFQTSIKHKIWTGYNDTADNNPQALKERPYSPFKINIPKDTLTCNLDSNLGKPIFSVMLKGASKTAIWPSLNMWKTILLTIKQQYPEARFLITGLLSAHINSKAKETEQKNRIFSFISSIPDAVNCYDIGLDNQLALIQNSDVFISPHTGFAFLAPCLGTPWLALSGGKWAEPMPAHRPFYSVLPACENYPCNNGDMKLECKLRLKLKQPIKCMSHLHLKKEDLLQGLEKLLSTSYSFQEAFVDYEDSAKKNKVNLKKLWRLNAYKNSITTITD
jgi:ADP-heptose:LPS heptosyltransferase